MCGIAGILRFERSARVEQRLLTAMADSIAHRGPDDEGYFVDGNVGLAHRRLSIIDLDGGRQPLSGPGGTTVVFNGEIYNYRELTAELEAGGHRFATRSDTETIVHAYERYGAGCVERFRGMFAFALWDARRRRLLLARDRLGIKPLYYYSSPGLLVFASEIKALLEHPAVPREVDPEALELYLALRYVPGPRTMFRGIFKLQPGHLMVCDENGPRIRRWWDLPTAAAAAAPADPGDLSEAAADRAVERFVEVLDESVRLRLAAEVPLGLFLSGGLDSTSVLATRGKVAPERRFHAFAVGYRAPAGEAGADGAEERQADELGWARLAADSFGAELHELRLGPDEFRDFMPDLVWHLDEPVADPACVPLFFISRLARREITVVLSGEGADEILAGYGIYRRMLALERAHRGLGPLARLAGPAGRLLPGERLRHAARLAGLPLDRRYRGVSRGFLPELGAELLGRPGGRRNGGGGGPVDEVFGAHFAAVAGAPPLDRMLYADAKTWLPDDLLVKADKMTMANSQELRVPFLDHRLVELAASLPAGLKIHRGVGKALLRRAMAGTVPEPILKRSKMGFPVPTVPLLRRLDGFARELLLDPGSACRDRFEPRVVARLLDEHKSGAVPRDQEIWSLLVFELWHGLFLDGRFEPARRFQARLAPPAAAVEAAG
jgi:asparagine synthase (glutamine-hydrolysing)